MAHRGTNVRLKAIVPKALNTKAMEKIIRQDFRKMGDGMKKDLDKTVATWETDVNFQLRTKVKRNVFTMDVRPKVGEGEKIFSYVDLGTKKHRIPKVGNTTAKPLYFQWGGPGSYKAKTTPRELSSTSGGPSGPMVSFKHVMHPGTEPRKFSETIARRWGQLSRKHATKTMGLVARFSGHSMRRYK